MNVVHLELPSVGPVYWSPGSGGCVHWYRGVPHPWWGVTRIVLWVRWPLVLHVSLEGWSVWLSLSERVSEGLESCSRSSSTLQDVDQLSCFSRVYRSLFDLVVIPHVRVLFEEVGRDSDVESHQEHVYRFLVS